MRPKTACKVMLMVLAGAIVLSSHDVDARRCGPANIEEVQQKSICRNTDIHSSPWKLNFTKYETFEKPDRKYACFKLYASSRGTTCSKLIVNKITFYVGKAWKTATRVNGTSFPMSATQTKLTITGLDVSLKDLSKYPGRSVPVCIRLPDNTSTLAQVSGRNTEQIKYMISGSPSQCCPIGVTGSDCLTCVNDLHTFLSVPEPKAKKIPVKLVAFNDTRIDNYEWLRDDNRTDQAVVEYLKAENNYTLAVMSDTLALQDKLIQEYQARFTLNISYAATRFNGYYYYSRLSQGQAYPVNCRRKVPSPAAAEDENDTMDMSQPEEVLLDQNKRAAELSTTFYAVGFSEPSPDSQLYAFPEDTTGLEDVTIPVMNISTKQIVSSIARAADFFFSPDSKYIYYTKKDETKRPSMVLRHKVGTASTEDVVLYQEDNPAVFLGLKVPLGDPGMLYIIDGTMRSDGARYLDITTPTQQAVKVLFERKEEVRHSTLDSRASGSQVFYIYEDSVLKSGELRFTSTQNPSQSMVLLPHNKDARLTGFTLRKGYIAVYSNVNGLQQVTVYTLPADGTAPTGPLAGGYSIAFPDGAYSLFTGCADVAVLSCKSNPDVPIIRYVYESFNRPSSVIDFNMETRRSAVKRTAIVRGGYNSTMYATQRVLVPSADGVQVPLDIVYKKDALKLDGTNPVHLNAYGSYEISVDPRFNRERLSLLDRGYIYAVAHVRGGGELGPEWHEAGRKEKRSTRSRISSHVQGSPNFELPAEYLVINKFTTSKLLSIEGGSAGGMLMGAAINARPQLFGAAILQVPAVDLLTLLSDSSNPISIANRDEFGDPTVESEYLGLKAYSPYDNIKPGVDYPHMLATGGYTDPRVPYYQPAKYLAKIRDNKIKGSKKMTLLLTDFESGHFGVSGILGNFKRVAFVQAFIMKSTCLQGGPCSLCNTTTIV